MTQRQAIRYTRLQLLEQFRSSFPELVHTYGSIRAWEKEDAVKAGEPNAAGWIVPDADNIHRRYPDVAILIPDTMGRSCGGLCVLPEDVRFPEQTSALRPAGAFT